MLYSLLAFTTKNVQFEPQNPGGLDVGVTADSVGQYSGLGTQDPLDLTVMVINWILGLLGLVFIVLVIYGGILWMTSAGNDEQIEKAKKILTASIIGLVIILVSYGATYFIFNMLVNVTSTHF